MNERILLKITALRQQLHGLAEPSMRETETKRALAAFLSACKTLELHDEGAWFWAKKYGKAGGNGIAFRADFDAVLCADGKARHLCGHDGHSAVLCGLALMLDEASPERDVYLIFQPGEETGEGAKLCAALIAREGIREIYGFHNIPGLPTGTVLCPDGTFACASTGMEIRLTGASAHAAYPEAGKNPAGTAAEIIRLTAAEAEKPHRGILFGTVIGVALGSASYGVAAGEGTVRLTLRAEYGEEYDRFADAVESGAHALAQKNGIACETKRLEEFPATENRAANARKVREAAQRLGLAVAEAKEPMRWSEDFGWYLKETAGAFFGVGCGETHAQLHTAAYAFEDELLGIVPELFFALTAM